MLVYVALFGMLWYVLKKLRVFMKRKRERREEREESEREERREEEEKKVKKKEDKEEALFFLREAGRV